VVVGGVGDSNKPGKSTQVQVSMQKGLWSVDYFMSTLLTLDDRYIDDDEMINNFLSFFFHCYFSDDDHVHYWFWLFFSRLRFSSVLKLKLKNDEI